MVSDWWTGLDGFFEAGSEIVVAHNTEEAMAAIEMTDAERTAMAGRARERTLDEHTAERRARTLITLVENATRSEAAPLGA